MAKEKKVIVQTFEEMEAKGKKLEAMIKLSNDMRLKERRLPIPFNEFLYQASTHPDLVFRDIFQLFYDMVHYYMGHGINEYPDDRDSIGFVGYDTSEFFVKGCDNPFFADRLFSNRLMNLVKGFRQGSLRNHIILFEGPPGSGKSTFLNNLLLKLEDYTRAQEGLMYKTYWCLDLDKLGGLSKFEEKVSENTNESEQQHIKKQISNSLKIYNNHDKDHIDFSCPKHDHPILQIPKSYRQNFLDELIPDDNFKDQLFNNKEYEWVLKDIPCNICKSLYSALLDELGDPMEVFNMVKARKMQFNRQFGEGISVYNPGDEVHNKPITNVTLQNIINELLKTDRLDFVYSSLAKTNNGILALMDIKENNVVRLNKLHGIISDGIHKVDLIEENIKTLFLGLVNPEDKVHYEKVKSFQDRIITVNIPYILDYNTEVAIYKNKFGDKIEKRFLPRVLTNFAKIIISSRLEKESPAMKKWIKNPDKYKKYQDKNFQLLKMDIYTGKIPSWLDEDELKSFDKNTRKEILSESENEGKKGFSGRLSLKVFNEFYSKYSSKDKLISMENVLKFFSAKDSDYHKHIPDGFIDSLISLYDYNILQEVKDAIYYYNKKQISKDIMNYLFAINYEPGSVEKCDYTGDLLEITEDYFKNFEALFLGTTSTEYQRKTFRKDNHREYISKTLSQEISIDKKKIDRTEQFDSLFKKYTRNLKENSLAPYYQNENFRQALKDFGTVRFDKYDSRLKRDVLRMVDKLKNKFGYSGKGAVDVCIYVLDNDLIKKFLS